MGWTYAVGAIWYSVGWYMGASVAVQGRRLSRAESRLSATPTDGLQNEKRIHGVMQCTRPPGFLIAGTRVRTPQNEGIVFEVEWRMPKHPWA
jgi:hypothetical protein